VRTNTPECPSSAPECSYRSINGTYTSKNTPKMPVPVPLMDLYGHLCIPLPPPPCRPQLRLYFDTQ
jgi:hypothetical protein